MFDKLIRGAIVSAIALAIIASFTVRAHAAPTDCPKPAKHRKHHASTPLQSCVAPLPLVLATPVPDPLPITVVTRYQVIPDAPLTSAPTPLAYAPDAWIPFPVFAPFDLFGGGGYIGSRTITYISYNSSTVTNTTNTTVNDSLVITNNVDNSMVVTTIINTPPSDPRRDHPHRAPEIGADNAVSGLTLLGGLLLVSCGRRQRKVCTP
jgi:hypothetical protein